MKIRTLAAIVGAALLFVGPTVGMAEEKPWQALQAVAAAPMNPDEMNAVTGKGNLFTFLASSGTQYSFGTSTVMFWASGPVSAAVSGPFGVVVLTK